MPVRRLPGNAQPALVAGDPRWEAVQRRDLKADGQFLYSVRTTGVYCRPSCAARLPRPENVAFHSTPSEAEQSGFRACKRCKPNHISCAEERSGLIAQLCRALEQPQTPTLQELAEQARLSAFHLHRVFKAATGLTPHAYAAAYRANTLRSELAQSQSVTEAIYAAGFSTSGRFYAKSKEILGMAPSKYRQGGVGMEIRFTIAPCSLGLVLVGVTEKGICAIFLGDSRTALVQDLERRFAAAKLIERDAHLEELVGRVVELIELPSGKANLPLDIRGTAFQERVWQALRKIPPGTTTTYAEIARAIAAPKAFRAVAQACGANPVAVAIPCHRVLRTGGDISGYRWGVERKRALLEREVTRPRAMQKKGERK